MKSDYEEATVEMLLRGSVCPLWPPLRNDDARAEAEDQTRKREGWSWRK